MIEGASNETLHCKLNKQKLKINMQTEAIEKHDLDLILKTPFIGSHMYFHLVNLEVFASSIS